MTSNGWPCKVIGPLKNGWRLLSGRGLRSRNMGEATGTPLKQWLWRFRSNGNISGMRRWDIVQMLREFRAKTGLPCNAHTFRRSFASMLAKRGVESLHITRLGRRESISMVDRYTKSVRFEDSLKLYSPIVRQ